MVKIDDLNVSSLPFGYCEHEGDEDEDEDDGFIFPSQEQRTTLSDISIESQLQADIMFN